MSLCFGLHKSALHGRSHREKLVLCCAVLVLFAGRPTLAAGQDSEAQSRLASQLEKVLTPPQQARLTLGARVVELPGGRVLYDHQGSEPLIPASNMKLVAMAAAIDQLGGDFKFQTVLAVRNLDLVVIGGGDPTFGDERLADARGDPITAVFQEWAEAMKSAGVRQIPGNIVVDDSIFERRFTHPQWPSDQFQSWYEAPIGGLNFNANCIEAVVSPTQPKQRATIRLVPDNDFVKIRNRTTTGKTQTVVISRARDSDSLVLSGCVSRDGRLQPITIRDPGMYFGSVLKTALAAEGIQVGGEVVREKVRLANGRLPDDCNIVAVHHTPLADALQRCGKDSLNMMAEGLFKMLGAHRSGLGSWESGRSTIHAFLRHVGVPADQVTVSDGSGLSRENRLSAAAATKILAYMFQGSPENFELFRDSLSVSGEDGTLRRRLRKGEAAGRIFGKTGTINGVRTLSGFVHTVSGRWLAFAFYYNYSGRLPSPKPRMDQACRLLVHWSDDSTSRPTTTQAVESAP